ncbi:hypothetical protein ACVWZV_004549 [Bradyrhizobium sp. GM5.1]
MAQRIRQSSERILQSDDLLCLEHTARGKIGDLAMASERQIAANRSNAGKSTGPRSCAGKKRARQNAYRHGLTLSIPVAAFTKQLEQRAREIADGREDEIILEYARAVAHAELDLARVRQVKVALIERVSALGALDGAYVFDSAAADIRSIKAVLTGRVPSKKVQETHVSARMPTHEPDRTAEAVRRALPELRKLLARYECRAAARRDRAIGEIMKRSERGGR